MKKFLKFKNGFTFLEVLASLVILSFALIPILNWVPTTIQNKIKAKRQMQAIFLAESELEKLRANILSRFSDDYNKSDPQSFNAPYQDFRFTVSDDLNSNLKSISVKVWHIDTPQDETVFYTQVAQR